MYKRTATAPTSKKGSKLSPSDFEQGSMKRATSKAGNLCANQASENNKRLLSHQAQQHTKTDDGSQVVPTSSL